MTVSDLINKLLVIKNRDLVVCVADQINLESAEYCWNVSQVAVTRDTMHNETVVVIS
jgi:hypothetical protein